MEYEPSRADDREPSAGPTVAAGDPASARRIDRLAADAWPAEIEHERDGWLLRHTPGVRRRRSNCAVPPATGGESALAAVERFYRDRDRPVIVQVGAGHDELDAVLAERGYRRDAPTAVLTARTADVISGTEHAAIGTELTERPGRRLDVFTALDEHADSAAVGRKVIARIAGPVALVSAHRDGRPAGMGLFAAASGWAGVFCMVTRPDARRRGMAASVLGAGTRWAAGVGADRLYLQVEDGNEAAHALYDKVGFVRSHGYHYRIAP